MRTHICGFRRAPPLGCQTRAVQPPSTSFKLQRTDKYETQAVRSTANPLSLLPLYTCRYLSIYTRDESPRRRECRFSPLSPHTSTAPTLCSLSFPLNPSHMPRRPPQPVPLPPRSPPPSSPPLATGSAVEGDAHPGSAPAAMAEEWEEEEELSEVRDEDGAEANSARKR